MNTRSYFPVMKCQRDKAGGRQDHLLSAAEGWKIRSVDPVALLAEPVSHSHVALEYLPYIKTPAGQSTQTRTILSKKAPETLRVQPHVSSQVPAGTSAQRTRHTSVHHTLLCISLHLRAGASVLSHL